MSNNDSLTITIPPDVAAKVRQIAYDDATTPEEIVLSWLRDVTKLSSTTRNLEWRRKHPERPVWDDYFLGIASAVSRRATCPRASVGVVFVDARHRIVATGYNGSPPGQPHCIDVGCLMVDGHCARVTHSEANAVAYGGRDLAGSTLYIHGYPPCHVCAKLVLTAGVVRIVWSGEKDYTAAGHPDDPAAKMLADAGVKLERI